MPAVAFALMEHIVKKNKLSIIFAFLTFICIISVAATADKCGCSVAPISESEDIEDNLSNIEEEEDIAETEEIAEGESSDEGVKAEEEKEEEKSTEETTEEEEEEQTQQQQLEEEAPTINLEIYEGPTYSSSDSVCYYRIKATVTGSPPPIIEFSKDDSNSAWGKYKAQVNLNDPSDTYTLTATATSSAGSATDSINLSWGCPATNNPPVISEITFMGDHYAALEYTFSAAASDPDGDSLSYSWSVEGGILNNASTNPVKWTMPPIAGNYDITVAVDDGNGGQAHKTETVEVLQIQQAQHIMECPLNETGYIVKDIRTNVGPGFPVFIGDDEHNEPIRGFINFDIRDLSGVSISEVNLKITSSAHFGDPFNNLIQAFRVNVVDWGNDPVELNDFNLTGTKFLGEYPNSNISINNQALIDSLQMAINNGEDNFQIMMSHKGWQTNHNNVMDYILYQPGYIRLIVCY